MMWVIGVVLFALAILVSVALHECGHMWVARATGMKVRRYFVGFGPTLWSTRRRHSRRNARSGRDLESGNPLILDDRYQRRSGVDFRKQLGAARGRFVREKSATVLLSSVDEAITKWRSVQIT